MIPGKKRTIALLDAFHTGSHKRWSLEFQRFSRHDVYLFTLPGRNWKWRMHGASISLAKQLIESGITPDIILVTDMLDLSVLISLTRKQFPHANYYIYFHENQLSYPWSPTDRDTELKRNIHYSFINYTSALAADRVFFNSNYHQRTFLEELFKMLSHFPDHKNMDTVEMIEKKTCVLPLGMDLKNLEQFQKNKTEKPGKHPVILWNHRWEFDKNPEEFFRTLLELDKKAIDFKLIVAGESFSNSPNIFAEAKKKLHHRILHFGYAESEDEYYKLVRQSDIIPVTSNQDFFGSSIVEALFIGCMPLLPDRLAYQDHIPDAYKPDFIYKTQEEFFNMLETMILKYPESKIHTSEMMKYMEKYDWSKLIKVYDDTLAAEG